MKDYYSSLEEAFTVLEEIARSFDPANPPSQPPQPPQPPGFRDMLLMVNTLGTSVCAWTILGGQLVSLSIIVPSDKSQNDRYFVNAQEVRRTLPQLEIDMVGNEGGEPGGVSGDGLKGLGLGIKWAMLRNGLDTDEM